MAVLVIADVSDPAFWAQAKELGIEIDLNYRFAQKSDEDE